MFRELPPQDSYAAVFIPWTLVLLDYNALPVLVLVKGE